MLLLFILFSLSHFHNHNLSFPNYDWEKLDKLATEARNNAYSEYSNFSVGASILSEAGRYYTGCNIENWSFGLTMCAERVAVFKMVSSGERKVLALSLATSTGIAPCGACCQVLREFSGEHNFPLRLISLDKGKHNDVMFHDLFPYVDAP